MKPNRGLSDWIWNNPHIDDMQKAQILPFVRGKEEIIARLEIVNKQLREFCGMVYDSIDGGGRVVTFQDVDVEELREILAKPLGDVEELSVAAKDSPEKAETQ